MTFTNNRAFVLKINISDLITVDFIKVTYTLYLLYVKF